jgi:hypothetical protein
MPEGMGTTSPCGRPLHVRVRELPASGTRQRMTPV